MRGRPGDAVLDALGDATRRSIVDLLAERPRHVRELADRLPVTRSAVSQHLRVLKEARLVRDEPVGARRVYRLDPDGYAEARPWLDAFWRDALQGLKEAAEAEISPRAADGRSSGSPG